MPKHGGCYLCCQKQDEVLVSVLDIRNALSVALCSQCRALDNDTLRGKLDSLAALLSNRTVSVPS
jgi:hypothetical protein